MEKGKGKWLWGKWSVGLGHEALHPPLATRFDEEIKAANCNSSTLHPHLFILPTLPCRWQHPPPPALTRTGGLLSWTSPLRRLLSTL